MKLECGDATYTCLSVPRNRYLAKGWLVPKTSKVSDRYECNYWAKTTLTQTTFGRAWRTHNTPNFLYRLRPQADNIDGVVKEQPQQNLKFADAGAMPPIPAPSISFRPDQDDNAHLGEFLSRPVRIANLLWTVGDPIGLTQTIYPWRDYFNTSSISNKLKNYARLRCKLHLKIVANTSPFLYGSLRYCYVPVDGHLRNQYLTDADQITFSQAPGVWVQPQDNTSFEMELPFLSPRTWIDTTKQSELQSLGVLYGITYASLASANGVTANANVQIYAWASEVELAGLTTQLVLQSDEYEAGPISSTATAVADVAAKLKNVPVIGSLAKATEIGARTTGAIASLFGYSNPPVIDDVKAYAPKSFHSMAATETGFPMDKLSIDPKNEITVDKTVTGADAGDPLVISRFAGRESFVTGCGWTDANPPGFQLLRVPITPRTYGGTVTANYNTYNETPACRAAALFSMWRGSMIFKLKFIKSRFHTGRVAITWDPAGSPGATYETECVTRIVDIQTESEVSFVVPFKAADAWLKTTGYQKNWAFTGAGSITYDSAAHNGVLRVEVLNELTGPAATSSITVLLMSAAGADIQFAAPQALPLWSSLVPQSDEWSLEEAEQLAAPAEDGVQPQVTAVTVGETVVSLRPLLHRSSLAYTGIHGDSQTGTTTFLTSSTVWNTSYVPRFPLNFGYNGSAPHWANGVVVPAGTFKFGFVPVHPLVWVGECFAGYRGGIVHQLNVIANGMPFLDALKAERDNRSILLQPTRQAVNRFSVVSDVGNKGSSLPRTTITQSAGIDREVIGHRGMAMTNMNTQSGLSIVTPQYSKWKFRPVFGDRRDKYNDQTDDESIRVTSVSRCGSASSTVDAGWPVLQDFVSGGVDFDLIYFVYVPRMYSFNTPGAVDTLF